MFENHFRGILLKVLGIGHNLHHAVPDFISDMVTSGTDELQDCVDIPLVGAGILLGQDGNFQDHLLSQGIVGDFQISQKFTNNDL
jgi:hypothetical protein